MPLAGVIIAGDGACKAVLRARDGDCVWRLELARPGVPPGQESTLGYSQEGVWTSLLWALLGLLLLSFAALVLKK